MIHELARREALAFLAAPAAWPSNISPATPAAIEYGERLNRCMESHFAAKTTGRKSPTFKSLKALVRDPDCPEHDRGRASELLQSYFGIGAEIG
jgi:hypothetical protein